MDGMKISSAFLTGIISKILAKTLKKKLGLEIDIQLNEIKVTYDENGKIHASINADADMSKDELKKLLGNKLS